MGSETMFLALAAIVGAVIGFLVKHYQVQSAIRREEIQAGRITEQAKKEAREIEIQAKDQAIEIRQRAEKEMERRRKDLNRQDDRIQKRRADIDRQSERLEQRE